MQYRRCTASVVQPAPRRAHLQVPDPWFDDDQERRGFHRVLDLLDDACEGLLASIQSAKQQAQS